MYNNDRNAFRQFFFTAWQKHEKRIPLDLAEARLVDVMLKHPQYLQFVEKPDAYTNQEFATEENPFIHMSLHHALQEQIDMDRPAGIKAISQQLKLQHDDAHEVEHQMMACLCKMMAKAQQTGITPGDDEYLELMKHLL